MSLTPEQRTLRAKLAANKRWGRTPISERQRVSAAGRRAFLNRFLAEVDAENPGLPEAERQMLAANKLSAHMTWLALKSSRARTPDESEARVA